MTRDQVEELRRLDAEATPGPWEAWRPEDNPGWFEIHLGDEFAAEVYRAGGHDGRFIASAKLIAAMRNALPALLSTAERCAELEGTFEDAMARGHEALAYLREKAARIADEYNAVECVDGKSKAGQLIRAIATNIPPVTAEARVAELERVLAEAEMRLRKERDEAQRRLEEQSHCLLADEERRKLTGDALAAEAALAERTRELAGLRTAADEQWGRAEAAEARERVLREALRASEAAAIKGLAELARMPDERFRGRGENTYVDRESVMDVVARTRRGLDAARARIRAPNGDE